jgi:hypothetical protein
LAKGGMPSQEELQSFAQEVKEFITVGSGMRSDE